MNVRMGLPILLLLALGACDEALRSGQSGFITTLPESVVAMAAPNQDLTAVQLREEDGCLWYRHAGPVETTMLPLRNVEGRPICTQTEG